MRDAFASGREGVPALDVGPEKSSLKIRIIIGVAGACEDHIDGPGHELMLRAAHQAAKPRGLIQEPRGQSDSHSDMVIVTRSDDAHAADFVALAIPGDHLVSNAGSSDEFTGLSNQA